MPKSLKNIGFSHWFKSRLDDEKTDNHSIARVVAVHKDSYMLSNGEGVDIFAELSGNLRYSVASECDLPTTGDFVYADFYDDDTHAVIYGVLPRKTTLKRKSAGKNINIQLMATNIDAAFIIQSLDDNFNLRRLERYLVIVNESGIKPIILLSKSDLINPDEVQKFKQKVLNITPDKIIIEFSNSNQSSIKSIVGLLKKERTYCLLGSSGVGKTTLLNNIIGQDKFATKTVSKIQNKGRHTTTSRQLTYIDCGAMIIDTPGIRELGNISTDDGLDETFVDIINLSQNCKFSNCSHTNEKSCAILSAINTGELSQKRYQNYLKIKRESEFNQMSYLEKRKEDRSFGKFVKSVVKNKPRYNA
ncbi:MAG: ribosome small subunit-dependent GTPase A [Gammaproteobacteria bacterium]|nr:MAG: ribosome small subunit-dependent GTPase A [Gammaproteobacteria bacterium]